VVVNTQEIEYTMYFFSEVDNLEYVIEKFKLGYINAIHAARSADTFRVRCRDEQFRKKVDELIDNVGYQETTITVAKRLHALGEADSK
jgi:hypothetical protein